jgi:outer membrane protein assembly factor BamB
VYALDAATGAVRWRAHLADPVPGSALPCGNIDALGVVGTPVYDRDSGLIFAVNTQAGPSHMLYGLDARTGAIRLRRNVDPAGIDPATHLQRAALAAANSRVYIAYGGIYGDCGQYQGRVVAVPTSGNGPMLSFAVPTRREAGIWGPSGPAVTSAGEIVVTTGNGEATGGAWDHSDSVLRLSPTLRLLDGFAPTGWAQENSVDADLGSTGPLLLADGRALAAG